MKTSPIKTIKEITKAKKVAKKRVAKKVLTREEPMPVYFGEFHWNTKKEKKTSITHTIVVIGAILTFLAGLALLCINREILKECITIYNSMQ